MSSLPVPAGVRRLARRSARAALRVARRGVLARRLSRLRFPAWAPAWFHGREIVDWRGVRVAIDPGEAHGFHVYFLGDYARTEIDACVELARGQRWFADLGANIGLVSLAVARAVPTVRVLAVEPDTALCEWLRFNLSLNADLAPRVHVLQAAAADRDGDVAFLRADSPRNAGVGRIAGAGSPGEATDRVRGVAIGHHAAREGWTLDVIKIDVEGGELDALAGVWTAASHPHGLVIETHAFRASDPDAFNRALVGDLRAHDYAVDHLRRGVWTPLGDPRDLGMRGHVRATLARSR